ncbi:NnrU family protein [Microvirga soli]|jgi:uncharacterized membrane protein|uniref:NnrU family protein n=1 Tax=Microvirga soli TaxID=1854496 RepID=UPI00191F372C|nr:NnrU family protein [Microvirga soli]
MTEFHIAMAVFLAAHLIPASPGLRSRLIGLMGRATYLTAYSLLSLGLLAWLTLAAQPAVTVLLWDPAPWQRHVPFLAMPVAAFLLIAGLAWPNPLSISLRSGEEPGPIVAVTHHPVLWGFLIWAASHVPPNGSLVVVLLFSGMAAFSILGFFLLDLNARRRMGANRWHARSAGTSIIPFTALLQWRSSWTSLRPQRLPALIAVGACAWFILQGHALLIGPDPLAGLLAMR